MLTAMAPRTPSTRVPFTRTLCGIPVSHDGPTNLRRVTATSGSVNCWATAFPIPVIPLQKSSAIHWAASRRTTTATASPTPGRTVHSSTTPDQKDSDGDGIGDVCDTPGTDPGTDCVWPGCSGSTPRPIPSPRTVAGKGPLVVDGIGLTCIRTLTFVVGGGNDAGAGECSQTLPAASPT